MVFLIMKFYVVTVEAGGLWQLLRLLTVFKTPHKRRHTLQKGVMSVSVHGRRVPGLIFDLKCAIWLSYRRPIDISRSSLMVLL
jgi:hypothetical protein